MPVCSVLRHIAAALPFALVSISTFAAPTATPGQWEFTNKVTMLAPMNMAMPAATTKFCLKPEDVKDMSKQTMGGGQGKMPENCKMLDQKVEGNTVRYKMRCEGKPPTEVSGEVSYSGNTYVGKSTVDMSAGPQGAMKMAMEFSAKRIGDCQ